MCFHLKKEDRGIVFLRTERRVFSEDGALDSFSVLKAAASGLSSLFFYFFPSPLPSVQSDLKGDTSSCVGNGREITQSRRREQGNIVRKETIRAHGEAAEIAPG